MEKVKKKKDTSSTKLKVLLVAPGAVISTYDMFHYYERAFQQIGDIDVKSFLFHNLITYHALAITEWDKLIGKTTSEEDMVRKTGSRAARELILDIILEKPDVVFFFTGTGIPYQIYQEIYTMRERTPHKFLMVGYLTEAPYLDDTHEFLIDAFDVLFTNDLYHKQRKNPNDQRFVFYLPHSYDPVMHKPRKVDDEYHKDLFFCGTLFPERLELMKKVDWGNIDALISGGTINERWHDFVTKLNLNIETGFKANREVAKYYNGSKIALNIYRTLSFDSGGQAKDISNDAYSMGPRSIESVACGSFLLSDFRQEHIDVYGDILPVYKDAEELSYLISYFLKHDEERVNRANEARKLIKDWSYNIRAKEIVNIFYEALEVLTEEKNG